jgi:guanylate kinase
MKNSPDDIFRVSARPLLIVLSGSSGVGKDTVLARLKESGCPLRHVITTTTRPPRPAEIQGIHYHFVPEDKFRDMIRNNELLEWARVYGNWYGVPREPIRQALAQGNDTIIKVDIQGAATIKKKVPQAVFIFLLPASMEELGQRLSRRQTETSSELALRLELADEETKQLHLFDYVVYNKDGEVDTAVSQIKAIIAAEKCRVTPREIVLDPPGTEKTGEECSRDV